MDVQSLLTTPLAETPLFTGRAIAMFARDASHQAQMTGKVLISADLAERYEVKDERGVRSPSFTSVKFLAAMVLKPLLQQLKIWDVPEAAESMTPLSDAGEYFWNSLWQLKIPGWLVKIGSGAPNL